jgi:hypothetical protein
MEQRAEKDSGEGRRGQLGAGVWKANAKIQSGSYCVRFERPNDINRMVVHRRVGFFSKIAVLSCRFGWAAVSFAPW